MDWQALVAVGIRTFTSLYDVLKSRQLIKAGDDAAVARAAAALLARTEAGKELRDRLAKLEDPETDALWDRMLDQ